MRLSLRLLLVPFAVCLAACTQFPELDATVPPEAENAPFPKLVPIAPLLAANAAVVTDPEATTQSLEARVSALRARANRLQNRPVIDRSTRARLSRAITSPQG